MLDLDQLQILGQLVDNIEIISERLEKSFRTNDGAEFTKSKDEILNVQKKIAFIISENKKN